MSTRPLSIVHTENSCGWGGQEVRILTESRGFINRGHQVTLLSPPEAPITEAARRMGVPVVEMPIRRKRLPELLALRRWIAEHRATIDVINSHSSTDSWLDAIACASLSGSPPVVRTRHVSTRVNRGAVTRWLYMNGNAHIVTTGEAVRSQLARDNDIPLDRMTSIPTGIDLDRFSPGDAHAARRQLGIADVPTLGIVATMRAWKGHEYLFDAVAAQREKWAGWQVLVVGGGPDREPLEAYASKCGLASQVRFAGHQEDVVPWLRSIDLFALPSYGEEGVPQAIMQAMACSVPVVSTPVGAIAEAVDAEVTGLLVQPKSAQALAAGLARLRDDPELRRRFGEASRTRAVKRFGIDEMLDRMEIVFRSVLRPRGQVTFPLPER